MPRRSWWWMRPEISRRAPRRSGCSASTPHRRQDRQRPGRHLPDLRHPSRARADRPGAVPATKLDARPRPLPRRRRPRPGRLCDQAGVGHQNAYPGIGRRGGGRLGDRRRGLRRRPHAARRAGGPARSATCWRSRATTVSWLAGLPTAPTRWPPGFPSQPGSVCPPGQAPRATAATTGRSSSSTSAPQALPSSAGCWCAATSVPASWPSTTALCPGPCRWPPWFASPGPAGGSRWSFRN
jgi:hypothetical protein